MFSSSVLFSLDVDMGAGRRVGAGMLWRGTIVEMEALVRRVKSLRIISLVWELSIEKSGRFTFTKASCPGCRAMSFHSVSSFTKALKRASGVLA